MFWFNSNLSPKHKTLLDVKICIYFFQLRVDVLTLNTTEFYYNT